jgi:hypothetical protein
MRKRGTYGLTNTIHTNKIGGFLPYIVLDGEALFLMPGIQELQQELPVPGKLPNSPSFDDAGCWTLGA